MPERQAKKTPAYIVYKDSQVFNSANGTYSIGILLVLGWLLCPPENNNYTQHLEDLWLILTRGEVCDQVKKEDVWDAVEKCFMHIAITQRISKHLCVPFSFYFLDYRKTLTEKDAKLDAYLNDLEGKKKDAAQRLMDNFPNVPD